MKKIHSRFLLLISMTLGTGVQAQTVMPNAIRAAVQSPSRHEKHTVRDVYRHPAETLAFFGVTPKSKIVEIWPSGGYWTEILAPLVKDDGQYTAVLNGREKSAKTFQDTFAGQPKLYGKISVTKLDPPASLLIAPDGTADFVLTFRNVHNWMAKGQAEAVFAAFYKALKKGGYLGLEEHRASDAKPQDPKAESGYVRQDYVMALAKKAGFTLVSASEINANPKDGKDYEKGVWTLPPTLTLGDKDKAKYQAIGESDRMTLLFRK